MENQLQNLLNIAKQLIIEGKSTIETAFVDAINLDRTHTEGMLKALSAANAPSPKLLTGYDEVYMGIIEGMSKEVYEKINAR